VSSVPSGTKIFSIVTGYLTKRTKTSTTAEHEEGKCRTCLGGHKAIEGVHYIQAEERWWTKLRFQSTDGNEEE